MSKRATVSRGDLLRCLRGVLGDGPDPAVVARIAGFCGFPEVLPVHLEANAESVQAKPERRPPALVGEDPENIPEPVGPRRYWVPKTGAASPLPPPPPPPPVEPYTMEQLRSRSDPLPPKPPLQRWARLWPYLRQALGCQRESGRLDVRKLVHSAATLQPIRRLPRVARLIWAPQAIVLLDHRNALMPFWGDMSDLVSQLTRWRGASGLRVELLANGLEFDRRREVANSFPLRPEPRAPILALSDLGGLNRDRSVIDRWLGFGIQLRRRGHRVRALLPCPRNRWDERLCEVWRCSGWDRVERPHFQGLTPLAVLKEPSRPSSVVEKLLDLISPALRCEAEMMRDLRLLLASEGADVGTEFDAWYHGEVERGKLAVALRAAAGQARRERLSREFQPLMSQVSRVLEKWHAGSSAAIRAKETLNLHRCQANVAPEQVERARAEQSRLAETILLQVRSGDHEQVQQSGLIGYFRRDMHRTSETELAQQRGLAVGYAVARISTGATVEALPAGLPELILQEVRERLVEPPAFDSLWEVRWVGNRLRFQRWRAPGDSPLRARLRVDVPVTWLWMRQLACTVRMEGSYQSSWRQDISLNAETEAMVDLGTADQVTLQSDRMSVTLESELRPPWAVRSGYDPFGRFAEFEHNSVRFPLRWIPPGTFRRGLPEMEPGKRANEVWRQVTLSRGFWLGATPATQAQWHAVMGKNPSESKEPTKPVSHVSWEDVAEFHTALSKIIPVLRWDFPTEAQWEFACRAGTETDFDNGSTGAKIERLDAALQSLGWSDSNSDQRNDSVAEKRPNAWGLVDLPGYAWEWCKDCADLTGSSIETAAHIDGIVDPYTGKGAWRVARSGKPWAAAWGSRAAVRSVMEPGYRSWDLGFRLATGYGETRSGEPGPEGSAGRPDAARRFGTE